MKRNPAARGHSRRKSAPGRFGLVLAVLAVVASAPVGRAEEAPNLSEFSFMGRMVKPLAGRYLVTKDVNIRAIPDTAGKRLGLLDKGEEVEAVGMAGDAWIAARQHGRDLGFVYAPVLLPLVDGRLAAPVRGATARGDDRCRYLVRYEGRNPVEGELFHTSDYDVGYRCVIGGSPVDVSAYMFITEAPYALTKRQVYQISVDLPDLSGGYDDVMSTVFLFKRDEGRVAFDRITVDRFKGDAVLPERTAASARDAVLAAVEMAPWAWSTEVWAELSGKASAVHEGEGPNDEAGDRETEPEASEGPPEEGVKPGPD